MSMTSNLQVAPTIPSEFTPAVPMSSSDFVVSRRMREYISDGARSFSYDGNNVIKFTLNSADAFLDGRNSWLQFKLFSTYQPGVAPAAAPDGGITGQPGDYLSRFLETGGAHSLFSRLRISLSNGTIISDYDYSQLYSMVRQHTMSVQHLQFQEGMSSFDGVASDIYEYGAPLSSKKTYQQITSAANPHRLTSGGGNLYGLRIDGLTQFFKVGDGIQVVGSMQVGNVGHNIVNGIVTSITDADNLVFTADTASAAFQAADGSVAAVYKILRGDASHRFRGAQGISETNHVLCKVKIFSDFFNNIKYLPLPFLRNLTIELTLNRPAHSVVFAKAAATTPSFSWTIADPVIVANLVTPSESLMNAYVEQYNSEQGIMLHWIDYQSNRVNAQIAQSDSVRIPSNCHSALAILVAQKLVESQSVVSGDSWINDTNGNNVKQSLSQYQFQVGSEYFPFARPVFCGDGAVTDNDYITNGNAWNYVLQALDSHGAKYECSSIVPNEYYAVNTITRPTGGAINNESLRFVLAARLDRDGNYTGIDTSNNDIQLNITRLANPNAGLYYHCFIIHNRLMRISKASSIVFS